LTRYVVFGEPPPSVPRKFLWLTFGPKALLRLPGTAPLPVNSATRVSSPTRIGPQLALRWSRSVTATIRRHLLAAYFVLAYAITWALVSPLVLEGVDLTGRLVPPGWHAFGALGPIASAFVVTAAVDGRPGIEELLDRMGRWRVGRTWLLLAVLSPFALFALSAAISAVLGPPLGETVNLGAEQLASFAWIVGVFYGVGEEPGWRGFALPRLQTGRSALSATLVLAVLWFFWHTPFFLYRYEFGPGALVGFFFGLLAGAVWLTCLYNSTGGSVLMCILWHTGFNLVNLPDVVSGQVLAIMSVLVMVAAVAMVVVFGPRTLSAAGKHEGPPFATSSTPRVR
jgi:membrane protease YdiL (CAAX protease family)